MHPFPHSYVVTATAGDDRDIAIESPGLAPFVVNAPAEFDGPGDRWSPETLLPGAIASCVILTFRAVAKASKLPWTALTCDVTGTLDRVDRVTRFTSFVVRARLQVPEGTDPDRARRLLVKADETCLVSRSLAAPVHLDVTIEAVAPAGMP